MNGSRSSDDKVFQAAGPDVENARGPNVDVSVLGTTSWLSSADRSRDRPKTEEVGTALTRLPVRWKAEFDVVPFDTVWVISQTVFPGNHLTGTSKQDFRSN